MEANKKYTPGPWKVSRTMDGKAILINDGYVAEVHSDDIPEEESEANAELIARAPETAERLEQAEKEIRELKEFKLATIDAMELVESYLEDGGFMTALDKVNRFLAQHSEQTKP